MVTHRSVLALIVWLGAFFASSAQAFFDPPWITPTNPMAGETVSINIHGGICDAIFGREGFPQITQEGNAIHIVEYGHHWEFQDFCIYGIGTVTDPIGTFPPGDYTVTVDFTYNDFLPAPAIVTLGVVPFTVRGAPAVAVPAPALGPVGLSVLSLVLVLAAWMRWNAVFRSYRAMPVKIMKHRVVPTMIALVAVFFAPSAQAFFDPPWITPMNPMIGEPVSINIHGGVCDGIFGREGFPQITQQGNAIRMIWYGEHWPEGSGDLLCSNTIGTLTHPFGAFPPGDYTLTVDLAYIDFSGFPNILTIGVVPFTVTGAPVAATPAPALGPIGLSVLSLVLALAAWLWRKRRNRLI